ncbi:VOC family protein [Microtetraspora niveoalba]|uniref:VOC family protein n=1 Tax=Microtetraspora niveoalba TaxID=46175 RepID=UPI00082E34AD|nr:VOC family protein [Microtetraspora niveoalba]
MTATGDRHAPAWFDISTPDSARARRFYGEMFGWEMNAVQEDYTLVGGEDGRPMAGIGQAGPGSPYTGIVVYFEVDDVDSALAWAEELGGSRRLDPQVLPGMGRMAVFTDPDGNAVGLLSP